MKALFISVALLFAATLANAQAPFPGLKEVMTEMEWKRAGLDRLTPDEIGVIDAAIIRHQRLTTSNLQVAITEARQKTAEAEAAAAAAATTNRPQGWLERIGLPSGNPDWRSAPPLKAKVVAWETANRFRLDNGQVWQGLEQITYELMGKDIEIQARPAGQFALVVDGVNTTLRVSRVR